MKVGKPKYYPTYMVQHGMQAIINEKKGEELIERFDSEESWKAALTTYLHCGE